MKTSKRPPLKRQKSGQFAPQILRNVPKIARILAEILVESVLICVKTAELTAELTAEQSKNNAFFTGEM